jgi:hypothetical protein
VDPCKEPARPHVVAWGNGNELGEFTLDTSLRRPSASVAWVERLVACGDTSRSRADGRGGERHARMRLKQTSCEVRSVHGLSPTIASQLLRRG